MLCRIEQSISQHKRQQAAVGIDFFDQWWMWLFPGLAIATLVMALNFIGDGLRDLTDPRLR